MLQSMSDYAFNDPYYALEYLYYAHKNFIKKTNISTIFTQITIDVTEHKFSSPDERV